MASRAFGADAGVCLRNTCYELGTRMHDT